MEHRDIERERKFVSILFADLTGYTAMSEQMDPEVLAEIVGECLGRLGQVVHHYEGYIDKFMGDAVMALFGAPLSHENDPERSIACALHMLRELEAFNREKSLSLQISIGINSGIVIAGSVGTEGKMDYTVMGDVVNVAQRVQGLANPGQILVTKNIVKSAERAFEFKSLPPAQVKGKAQAIEIFEVQAERRIDDSNETIHRSYSKLFGRTKELSQLRKLLEQLKHSSSAALISGDAGSGKSRLLHEIKKLTIPLGVRWLSSATSGVTKERPYGALIRILREMLDGLEWVDLGLDPIDEVNLKSLLESNLPQEISAANIESQKKATFSAIKSVINRFSEAHPAVIVFEDSHWMDPLSCEFINDYLGFMPAHNILVLISSRPETVDSWANIPTLNRISLRPIDDTAATSLACYLLNKTTLPDHLTAVITSRGEGNPLYIEELIKSLIDTQQIQFKDSQWVIAERLNVNEIPLSLRALIATRIDRLDKAQKSVLQVASVIGREFDDSLIEATGLISADLHTSLRALRKKELIFEYDVQDDRITYIFKHALTREVAYDSLLQKRRRECHAVIGTTIERSTEVLNNRLEILAYHFLNGDVKAKAIDYLQLCASKDAENFDNERAVTYFKEAIKLVESDTEKLPEIQNKIFELQNQAAWTLYGMGKLSEAEALMLKQVDLAKHQQQFGLLAQAYRRLGELYRNRGNAEKALEYLEQSMAIAREHNDFSQQVRTYKELAQAEKLRRNFGRSLQYLELGMASIEKLKNPKLEAAFWNDIAEVHLLKGDYEQAIPAVNLCLSLCQMIGTKSETHVWASNNLGVIYWYQRKLDKSLEQFQNSAELAKELGSPTDYLRALLNATEVLLALKDLKRAEALNNRCIQFARDHEEPRKLRQSLLHRSQILIACNRDADAKPILEMTRNEAAAAKSWDDYLEASLHLSKALENQGNEEGMRDLLYETQSTLKLHKLTDLEAKVEEYRQSSLKQKNTKGK